MKKTGIITIQFVINYGGLLQAYALREKINSFPDMDAEIFNYMPSFAQERRIATIRNGYGERVEKSRIFCREKLGIKMDGFAEFPDGIADHYSYLIAGSDQIWNYDICRLDKNYFLNFAPSQAVKIAYGASVGKPLSNISAYEKTLLARMIPHFDFLSVREKGYVAFISQYTDKKVESVLDPTLLLCGEDYQAITVEPVMKEPYLLVYFVGHTDVLPLLSLVNRVSRMTGLQVVHSFEELPGHAVRNISHSFCQAGPEEFLGLVKHAEIVLTNSFHGTIFSILFRKSFYCLCDSVKAPRVYDLLDKLDLQSRVVEGYIPPAEVSFDIDYAAVHSRLDELRKQSELFLKIALNID